VIVVAKRRAAMMSTAEQTALRFRGEARQAETTARPLSEFKAQAPTTKAKLISATYLIRESESDSRVDLLLAQMAKDMAPNADLLVDRLGKAGFHLGRFMAFMESYTQIFGGDAEVGNGPGDLVAAMKPIVSQAERFIPGQIRQSVVDDLNRRYPEANLTPVADVSGKPFNVGQASSVEDRNRSNPYI
jgi:hypothetical protein